MNWQAVGELLMVMLFALPLCLVLVLVIRWVEDKYRYGLQAFVVGFAITIVLVYGMLV